MFRKICSLILVFVFCVLNFSFVQATPSTTYWTPCVIDVQPFGKWHITYDTYFTVGKKGDKKSDFPTTGGLTIGVLPFQKLNLEIGFDFIEPSEDPVFFNAKFGTPESSLFSGSPALNIGIFNVGTEKNVTDYNIADFIIGKTLPLSLGRLHGGYYLGNDKTLISSTGEKENTGYMVGYDKYIYKDKVMFAGDYASGENALGGGGVGLYFFFTPTVSLLLGPVWFNDKALNGEMKWTSQLDINF